MFPEKLNEKLKISYCTRIEIQKNIKKKTCAVFEFNTKYHDHFMIYQETKFVSFGKSDTLVKYKQKSVKV